jgi:hypothetical protein
MADYFVDASQVGGNGTLPTSAYASVLSVPWGDGDRAWVRKSHYEVLTNSQFLGPNFNQTNYSRWGWVIGWPTSGDPFFTERPASGVSANWDTDVPSTSVYSVYGLRFPSFVSSTNAAAGMLLGNGAYLANLAFVNSGGGGIRQPWSEQDRFAETVVDNIVTLYQGGPMLNFGQKNFEMRFGKVTVVLSGSATSPWQYGVFADHMVLHASCVWSGALFKGPTGKINIGLLENLSNSLDNFFAGFTADNGATDASFLDCYIRRVSGIQPYSGAYGAPVNVGYAMIAIDDYFSQGPRIIGIDKPNTFLCSSAQAMQNGSRVLRYDVNSITTANINYKAPIHRIPAITKLVLANSGSEITYRIPLYVDSTAIFSPAAGQLRANLLARGAMPQYAVRSNVLPGSPSMWSGSFVSGGSAYLWEVKFTAQESGMVPLEIFLPPWVQTASGQPRIAYALFSEPYST